MNIMVLRKNGFHPAHENKFLETFLLGGTEPKTGQESVYLDPQGWHRYKDSSVYKDLDPSIVGELLQYCRAIEWEYMMATNKDEKLFALLSLSKFCRGLIESAKNLNALGLVNDGSGFFVSIGFSLKKALDIFRARYLSFPEYQETYTVNQKEE